MELKCKINGIEYNNLVQGFNISEEYNETLDSASIILSNISKIDLRPYDDVFIYEGEFNGYGSGYELPSFFLHLLVDQFTEEMINPSENLNDIRYKYKIDLFSETKRLETIQLPNFSITQPLDIEKKKSVYDYIVDIVDLYNPLYKVGENGIWHYEKKYKVDESLFEIFGQVYSPDFSLNNPSLRDVLTQLMLTKDMIPVVKNDVITALDFSKRNGSFNVNTKYITSIVGSRSSDNHCDSLKRTYNNALSQDNTCKMVEFLGFRNSESGMLTLENMRLETRYPIYKINKVYMCYYKKIKLVDNNDEVQGERTFLCKQDISKLVKLNSERNLLSEDWVDFENNVNTETTLDELAEYKIATIGYDIGSRYITGWGEKYSYIKNGIFDQTKTYIENILKFVDVETPYGIYNYGYITANSNPPIPEGYAYSGISGNLEDRVINVYSNLSLFMKSLFFEVEYNAFYNGTIIHSKDIDRDDIVMNDNSSSSLTLLEQDGIFQKEKVNRFGNKVIQINATYDSFDQLQELGSVYNYGGDTDVIIYHREISVNNNVINCVYYGSKDYVLKNYFTSVNARHRPFNLLSYDESVRRSENKKMYILMSKDNYFVEVENRVIDIDVSFIDKFLSFYKETELGASKGDFRFGEQINYGYFSYNGNYYASDVNAFASGTSLCFNIAMYDNVSGGIYLDTDKLEPEMQNVNDDYIRGSIQKWYITSDKETGFAEYMGFYVGHIDSSYFRDKQVSELEDFVFETNIYSIMQLPRLASVNSVENLVGNEYKINKDNKELIDMTYQIELITDSDDILISSWALRLSELLGNYLKFAEDKTARDYQNEEANYTLITSTINSTTINSGTYGMVGFYAPIMILKFSEDNLNNLYNFRGKAFKTQFIYSVDKSKELNGDGLGKDIIYYSFEGNEITSFDGETLELKGKQKVILDGGFLSNKNIEYPDDNVTITFKKNDVFEGINFNKETNYHYFSNCKIKKTMAGSYSIIDVEYFGNNHTIKFDGGNKEAHLTFQSDWIGKNYMFGASTTKYLKGEDTYFDETTFEFEDEYFIKDGSEEETIYKKNLYVTTSFDKLKKENVYDELKEINEGLLFHKPNEIFFITDNPNGNGGKCLAINTKSFPTMATGVAGIYKPTQSISLWYKDEYAYENDTEGLVSSGEKGYHFVFGVNLGYATNLPDYIYINLSLLSLKDRRVYDKGHNLIGSVKNEANSTELISEQKYSNIL